MSRDGHSTRNYDSQRKRMGCRGCLQSNTPCRVSVQNPSNRAAKREYVQHNYGYRLKNLIQIADRMPPGIGRRKRMPYAGMMSHHSGIGMPTEYITNSTICDRIPPGVSHVRGKNDSRKTRCCSILSHSAGYKAIHAAVGHQRFG